jgi:hypothetical protein
VLYDYFIVDGAQAPDVLQALQSQELQYESLFDGTPEKRLIEIAPLLFPVPNGEDARFKSLLKRINTIAHEEPAVHAISSQDELERVARHLRQFHIAKLPDDQKMILRWYDTRVFEPLLECLSEEQRVSFLGPIRRWMFWDRFGDQRVVDSPPRQPTDVRPEGLTLAEKQYAHLIDASMPYAVLRTLRETIPDELSRLHGPALMRFLIHHLNVAQSMKVEGHPAQVQFMLLALYTSGAFLDEPELVDWKERPTMRAMNFVDWSDMLPERVWTAGAPLWGEMKPVAPRLDDDQFFGGLDEYRNT